MTVFSQHTVFIQELEQLIEGEIDRLKDDMSAGLLKTHEEYKSLTGKISGLRAALEYMDEASSIVAKKLGA